MHRAVRWHYLSSIAISTVFVVGALVASWSYEVPSLFAQSGTINNIGGWAWSGNSGWISLNSLNVGACKPVCSAGAVGSTCRVDHDCDFGGIIGTCNLNSCPSPASYGLNLNIDSGNPTTGTVSGYAWSSSLGWVCFGSTCRTAPNSCSGALAPPSGSCDITFACKGPTCTSGDPTLVGKKCAVAGDCGVDALGNPGSCSALGSSASCQEASSADLTGWARELNLGASGWFSMSNTTAGGTTPYGVQVKFDQCYSTDPAPAGSYVDCSTGTNILNPNNKSTVFKGFAWNGSGTQAASPLGIGWVSFNYTPEVLFPYLYGGGGDVFSGRNISSLFPPPSDKRNAQYLVHIGGSSISSHFVSTCSDPKCKSIVPSLIVPATMSPSATAPYSFKLGRFDFSGLCTADATTHLNKYGQTVVVGFPVSGQALGGKVYCPPMKSNDPAAGYTGQKWYDTPSSTVNVTNGPTATDSGAGTVVVYGNLAVMGDVTYGATPNPPPPGWSTTQLASLTWVVLGDVRVDPSVKNIAGTFVVLGQRVAPVRQCLATGADCTASSAACIAAGSQCLEVKACNATGLSGSTAPTACLNDTICGPVPKTCLSSNPTYAGRVCSVPGDCGVGGSCSSCQPLFLAKDSAGDLNSGYGKFMSCVLPTPPGATCDQNPLMVSGSVFARQFKLTRTYVNVSTHDPAEGFVSDGRLQLNPPPGMSDFAKGLPVFSRQ